jgi:hypothetical protein
MELRTGPATITVTVCTTMPADQLALVAGGVVVGRIVGLAPPAKTLAEVFEELAHPPDPGPKMVLVSPKWEAWVRAQMRPPLRRSKGWRRHLRREKAAARK